MVVTLAIIAVILIVAIASLFFFGFKSLGNSVLAFSFSLIILFFGIQGINNGIIDMCSGGRNGPSICTTFQLKNEPFLFWVVVVLHFLMFIALLGIGIYCLNKANLKKGQGQV